MGGNGSDALARTAMNLLDTLLGECRHLRFAVRLWDGEMWESQPGGLPLFTLVLKHPESLRRMCWRTNELTLGEAYIYDDFDIEGDILASFPLADYLLSRHWGLFEMLHLARLFLRMPADQGHGARLRQRGRRHSPRRDAAAISYHYDLSNDFYRLWLDSRMIYSCAYFQSPDDPLDVAQERKLDLICRKLRLRPGEKLLDIGCGWGGLILHAALNYGVDATGITLSRRQAELAGERIREAGVSGRCRAEVRDYREMAGEEVFDKVVSVGMFEHVGEARLDEYFRIAWRLLRPWGVFLNHGIAWNPLVPYNADNASFIDKYVFPDGELLPISTTLRTAETNGFEVRDLESLREHYSLTLTHWVRRIEALHDEAVRLTSEVVYRTWRLYMAGAAHGFASNRMNLYQALLAKPDQGRSGLPLTRNDWYTPDGLQS
jgi:cyclopropane-fatty-acyl-phospholipid synthase